MAIFVCLVNSLKREVACYERPGGELYGDEGVGGKRKGTYRDFLVLKLGERVSMVRARLEKDNFFGVPIENYESEMCAKFW